METRTAAQRAASSPSATQFTSADDAARRPRGAHAGSLQNLVDKFRTIWLVFGCISTDIFFENVGKCLTMYCYWGVAAFDEIHTLFGILIDKLVKRKLMFVEVMNTGN